MNADIYPFTNSGGNRSIRYILMHLLTGLVIFLISFGIIALRINKAPDILTDEILYSRLGVRVLEEGAVVWDHGSMTVIHPPYYFLLNGVFYALTGTAGAEPYTPGNIFELVYHDRILNALFAGLTSVLLYMIGLRMRGFWLGIFLVLLFIIDPFGVRINRRAMLETLAGLFSMLGLLILITGIYKHRGLEYGIGAGIFFGAGILTKELVFIVPLAVMVFAIWELIRGRKDWRPSLLASSIAFVSYLIFPAWVLYTGNWLRFVGVKTLAIERLIGLVHTSGWNRPGVSFTDFIANRLLDYGSSYLILLLGGLATLLILVRHRDEAVGRLLGIWGLLIYPFYAFITLFGSGNDQFFYFLLLPSVILLGYALIEIDDQGLRRLTTRSLNVLRSQPGALFNVQDSGSALLLGSSILILVIILPFNLFSWISNFGLGTDNGYLRLSQYIQANIPAGTPINASGDTLKFNYFLSSYPIASTENPTEAEKLGVSYFVIAPKDIQDKFGNVSAEYAGWIVTNGQLIYSTSGETYGDIFLYHVAGTDGSSGEPLPGSGDPGFQRTFPHAETGLIGSLLVLMAIWYLLCLWMMIGAARRSIEKGYAIASISTSFQAVEGDIQDVP